LSARLRLLRGAIRGSGSDRHKRAGSTAGTTARSVATCGYRGFPATDYHGSERSPRTHPEPAALLRTDRHAHAPCGNERWMVGDNDRTRAVAWLVRTGCTVCRAHLPDRTTDVRAAAEFPASAEVEYAEVGTLRLFGRAGSCAVVSSPC